MNRGRATCSSDRGTQFYRLAALAALTVALAGFFLTYLKPLASGTFGGPVAAHIHGALLASWLLLVIAQTWLVPGWLALHRRLGWVALLLAPAIAASTMAVGVAATRRDIAQGISFGMAGNVTTPLLFLALVLGALALRRRSQWHKRLVFMATSLILWPAWFRWRHFLPAMERPDIWLGLVFAQMPLAVAIIRDRILFGAVHPAYWRIGVPLVAEQGFEVWAFGQPFWTQFGMSLYGALA